MKQMFHVKQWEFQSTPSAWRETRIANIRFFTNSHFNPLPPHGGRRKYVALDIVLNDISIHSLRMEGDKPP